MCASISVVSHFPEVRERAVKGHYYYCKLIDYAMCWL